MPESDGGHKLPDGVALLHPAAPSDDAHLIAGRALGQHRNQQVYAFNSRSHRSERVCNLGPD